MWHAPLGRRHWNDDVFLLARALQGRGDMNARLLSWSIGTLGVGALVIACGSGGPDASTTTSPTHPSSSADGDRSGSSSGMPPNVATSSGSSSGGSSGDQATDCGSTCLPFADITFDEWNQTGALDSAFIDACRAGVCAHGQVTTDAKGTRWLNFEPDAKGASDVLGKITELTAGPLRFEVRWTLPYDINQIEDGEVYTITAHSEAGGGATLFSRSFTAAYATLTICGETCKQWSEGP